MPRTTEKAITLVSLVVTIVILMILAGITIAAVTGDSGIIYQTKDAKDALEIEEIRENIGLAYLKAEAGKRRRNADLSAKIKAELDKTYGTENVTVTKENDGTYTVIVKENVFSIGEDGNIVLDKSRIIVGATRITDSNGAEISQGTKLQEEEGPVYIHFTVLLAGANDLAVTLAGHTPTLTNGEWITEVSRNGEYNFSITGTVDGVQATKTNQVNVNVFSNIPSGLKIGSTVTYDPSITTSTSNHTFNWEAELCSSTKTPTTEDVSLVLAGTGTNMSVTNWRVLSIDKENEIVELISTAPTANNVYLGEAQGYNNAVYLLNNACNSLYGGTLTKGGTTYTIEGRNVSIKDIEDRMTDTAKATAHSSNSSGTATWGNTTNAYTSHKNYPTIYYQEVDSKINGNALTGTLNLWTKQTTPIHRTDGVSELQSDGTTLSSKTTTDGKVQATTSIQPKQTSWNKDNSFMQTAFKAPEGLNETDGTTNTNYSLLMTNGSGSTATYLLASRCVQLFSDHCCFYVSDVGEGRLSSHQMCDSMEYSDNIVYPIRPILSLSATLISANGSNFQIVQDNNN